MFEPRPSRLTRAAERDALYSDARALVAEQPKRFRRVGEELERLTLLEAQRRDESQARLRKRLTPQDRERLGLDLDQDWKPDDPDRLVERCRLLGDAIVSGDANPLTCYINFTGRAPRENRLDAAAAFLLAILIVGDPDLQDHVGVDVTIFAKLPWVGENTERSNIAMGRWIADRLGDRSTEAEPSDEVGEPSDEVLARIRFAVDMLRTGPGVEPGPRINAQPSGAPSLDAVADACEEVDTSPPTSGVHASPNTNTPSPDFGRAVSKPDGWRKAELVEQAQRAGARCCASTFDNIRRRTGVPSRPKGGKGPHTPHSPEQLQELITAAEEGPFRDGKLIARTWRELLRESRPSESQMNPKL